MDFKMTFNVGSDGRLLGIDNDLLRECVDMSSHNSRVGDEVYQAVKDACSYVCQSSNVFQTNKIICYRRTIEDSLSVKLRLFLKKSSGSPEKMRNVLAGVKDLVLNRNRTEISEMLKDLDDHVLQARVILLFLSDADLRPMVVPMLRSGEFIVAKRILLALILEKGNSPSPAILVDPDSFRTRGIQFDIVGVFWALGNIETGKIGRHNSLGLSQVEYSDKDTLVRNDRVGFNIGPGLFTYGVKGYFSAPETKESLSYIMVSKGIERLYTDEEVANLKKLSELLRERLSEEQTDSEEVVDLRSPEMPEDEQAEGPLRPVEGVPTPLERVVPATSPYQKEFQPLLDILKQMQGTSI